MVGGTLFYSNIILFIVDFKLVTIGLSGKT